LDEGDTQAYGGYQRLAPDGYPAHCFHAKALSRSLDRESAEKVARAMRYLIGLCEGPPCSDCDPFQWQ